MKKTKKNLLRIGLIQMTCGNDVRANVQKAVSLIKKASGKGAKIVCLQELFNTVYFCNSEDSKNFDLAESIPGPTTKTLANVARATKTVVIAPIFEKETSGVYYNSLAVIDADGKLLGKYRKMHIPDDPGFYEKFYFVPGDLGFKVFDTKYGKIGALICWDQWFPEAARLTALMGAQILFYPTAIGWKPDRAEETKSYHSAWETVQRSHAIANGVYVAATNRVGRENGLKFWGSSFVADPFGAVCHRASDSREEIVIVDCDLKAVDQTRREWPFFRDRRIDAYGPISSRTIQKSR